MIIKEPQANASSMMLDEDFVKRLIASLTLLPLLLTLPLLVITVQHRVSYSGRAATLAICQETSSCEGKVLRYTTTDGKSLSILALPSEGQQEYYLLRSHPALGGQILNFENFVGKTVKVVGQATDEEKGSGHTGQILSGTIYVTQITLDRAGIVPPR